MRQADFAASVAFAQVVFWVFLPVVLFAPNKWAVLAWFLMGNLDASGGQFEATAAFGAINAAKALVLPVYLIWRLRAQRGSFLLSSTWARVWIAFIVWVAIASLWSPFPVSAAKAVAYLVGLGIGLVVFERSGRAGILDARFIAGALAGTLALGVIQHFVFRGEGYGFELTGIRFTAFVGAQGYAGGLVALLCAVLWIERLLPSVRAVLASSILVAMFFNGSRTWAIGAALALVVSSAVAFSRRPIFALTIAVVLPSLVLIATIAFGPSSLVEGDHAAGRITSAIQAISGSDEGLGSIQNVAYRYGIWRGVIAELQDSGSRELFFGHGTSSTAEVGIRAAPYVFATKSLDANRVAHNEWLRAIHEWGLLGAALWSLAYGLLVAGSIRMYIRKRSIKFLPLLSYLPAFTLATLAENVLVGAGAATIMGLLLLVGLAFQRQTRAALPPPVAA